MSARNLQVDQSGGYFTDKRHSTTYEFISPLRLDLKGRRVLITGAAWDSGVGYAVATAFARAGASAIAVADLHGVSDELIARLKRVATEAGHPEPTVVSHTVNIAQRETVQAMHDDASRAFEGKLDILINNAAHMEPNKSTLESDPDVLWQTWEVNIQGLINMTRAFLPMLLSTRATDNGLGTMTNVASSGALSARPTTASYRSSKLAMLRWTESLQLEYGGEGLLTFCVNPGAIKTKISEGTAPESVRDKFPDKPVLPGDTIAWLSAARKDWLGGRYVSCPWDMEELMAKKDEIVEQDKLKLRMVF
ncbi:NAD(P)-binding protein [Aureobasidium subglaciale]|nr:NAD(P)-binding protein [Aureobasidium subglaciale]